MKQKEFFTKEFYTDHVLALNVINELVERGLVSDQEYSQTNDLLFMEVYDNYESRDILKKIILDFDKYKAYNNANFPSDKETQIGLCAIQDEYRTPFRGNIGHNKLRWFFLKRKFVLAHQLDDGSWIDLTEQNKYQKFVINQSVKIRECENSYKKIGKIVGINYLDALYIDHYGNEYEETTYDISFIDKNGEIEYTTLLESDLESSN